MDLGTDEQRLAIEVIATLVNVRSTMVEMILKPAGVPPEIYKTLLSKVDPLTGKQLSKRKVAPLILDAVAQRPDCSGVVRSIIKMAANWTRFELAANEFEARATVQKAREVLGTIELMEAREAKQRELTKKEELARMEKERYEQLAKQSHLLLMMFDDLGDLTRPGDEQKRGYFLQELLNRAFDLHGIPVRRSFTRNEGAEQIDGAFILNGWHYLVECRWRQKLTDTREVDGLKGQVDRSGKQTMGVFLSINGWSNHVPSLLKQNPNKSIILMEGYDLRRVLSDPLDLLDFLLAKVAKLNLEGEPFLSVSDYLGKLGERKT
ncbi:MAG: restriction endonuclease [Chloroflexi bacterium]|nr:restriction endonuclease [Chloroflexota bacterium]